MNLTPLQIELVSAMTNEAQTARQLSERLGFDLQPVVESLSRLTKLGMVARDEIDNPEHGRRGAKSKCYGYRHAADAAEQESQPEPKPKPKPELQPEKGLFLAVDISNAHIHKLESDAHAAAEAMIADGATDVAVVRVIRTGTVAVVWS